MSKADPSFDPTGAASAPRKTEQGNALPLAAMAEPSRLNAQLTKDWNDRWGRTEAVTIHPDAFRCPPCGARLLMVVDPVPDKFGHIYLPDEYRAGEQMGIGTIMGVGPLYGLLSPTAQSGPLVETPEDLLYTTVITGQYIGTPIRLDYIKDESYTASVVMISDRDILATVSPKKG